MDIIYSPDHQLHRGEFEFYRGELVPCFEKPERADYVLSAVTAQDVGTVCEPEPFPLTAIERVHAPRYLRFLERAWDSWTALGNTRDAIPAVWPIRGFRHDVEPDNFIAQLGMYSFDSGTPFTAGTWRAARLGADIALTAQRRIAQGARAAFALSRPPGHHAGPDFLGGYCFINNAAVAAQAFIDSGASRVAILDVDYHHGNGTQSIFYERADVLFQSIHGDPTTEYPFYLGHADETGASDGVGFNQNYPLAAGSSNAQWFAALDAACKRIASFAPDALVVSLGVDTYVGDPISKFKLDAPEYLRMGSELAGLGLPTLFVMEGGYAVQEIGLNVAHVLRGFRDLAG
ncbi:histone deacetylase family protein [Noviherbaspirillum sp. Root189]|uniref:histone deacetylase family protein n=1 Tax=Noviherbaspirillum sp. Root189 TaxID=1736487 RepID=UPI00070EFC0E|nr:histone deacetylase family protein [Noviherbaspirillum sp. Root189]KRB94231.1 acetylpolyamine aminohydrolase [Noviherbaspirillum sp. Root189]